MGILRGFWGGIHGAIGLDAMFEAIKFPARVPDLATGLTDVDGDALTLVKKELYCIQSKKILKLCKMSSF